MLAVAGTGTSAWRKLAPPYLLALIPEYCSQSEEQVVLLFQVLSASPIRKSKIAITVKETL